MSPTSLPEVGKKGVPLRPQTLGGSFHSSTCEANHVAGDVVVGTSQQPETGFPDKLRKGQPLAWNELILMTGNLWPRKLLQPRVTSFSFFLSSSFFSVNACGLFHISLSVFVSWCLLLSASAVMSLIFWFLLWHGHCGPHTVSTDVPCALWDMCPEWRKTY